MPGVNRGRPFRGRAQRGIPSRGLPNRGNNPMSWKPWTKRTKGRRRRRTVAQNEGPEEE